MMRFFDLLIALILPSACQTTSALIVKEPGEFKLVPNTVLVVTSAVEGGVPALKYAVLHTNPDGKTLSSDSFSSRVDVGNPIVFYWEDSKQVLWWATNKNLVSVSRSTWEKLGDDASRWVPITYTMDERWFTKGGEKIPYGGVPVDFFEEVKRTFGP